MKLKFFLKKYGVSKTTNFDLKKIGEELNLNLKVIMRDELKETKKECVIMNFQTTNEQGSHWVCIYKHEYYFDPYGVIPPKEVFKYMKDSFIYNTLQVQPDGSAMCGQLCLFVLYKLSKGYRFEDIVLMMQDYFIE